MYAEAEEEGDESWLTLRAPTKESNTELSNKETAHGSELTRTQCFPEDWHAEHPGGSQPL